MTLKRTLRRRAQRTRAKHRLPPRPPTKLEQMIYEEGMRILKNSFALSRLISRTPHYPLTKHNDGITLDVRLPERYRS